MRGHNVTGLKRRLPASIGPFPILSADISLSESLHSVPVDFDTVILIVAPGSRQSEAYRDLYDLGLDNLLAHFAAARRSPRWLMVSSTSVYGQNLGEWVDETSPTQPSSTTAQWLVTAENRLWAADGHNCVVRFSGIYGPGRDWLLRRAANGGPIQQHPPSYTNRIHSEDCLRILLFLAEKQLAGEALAPCYLASDHDPAPLWEVMNWLTKQFDYPTPTALPATTDAQQNKRCRNKQLTELGYRFLYPSYRDGYGAMQILQDGDG